MENRKLLYIQAKMCKVDICRWMMNTVRQERGTVVNLDSKEHVAHAPSNIRQLVVGVALGSVRVRPIGTGYDQ